MTEEAQITDRVLGIVIATMRDVEEELGKPVEAISPDTPLIGRLDSLGLVTLVVDLEERIRDELGVSVTLASERAMSAKRSPFLTVASLADYVVASLPEPTTPLRTR